MSCLQNQNSVIKTHLFLADATGGGCIFLYCYFYARPTDLTWWCLLTYEISEAMERVLHVLVLSEILVLPGCLVSLCYLCIFPVQADQSSLYHPASLFKDFWVVLDLQWHCNTILTKHRKKKAISISLKYNPQSCVSTYFEVISQESTAFLQSWNSCS